MNRCRLREWQMNGGRPRGWQMDWWMDWLGRYHTHTNTHKHTQTHTQTVTLSLTHSLTHSPCGDFADKFSVWFRSLFWLEVCSTINEHTLFKNKTTTFFKRKIAWFQTVVYGCVWASSYIWVHLTVYAFMNFSISALINFSISLDLAPPKHTFRFRIRARFRVS